jgi:CheY-like chemotaxis protein
VTSEPHHGTTFTVYLPASAAPAQLRERKTETVGLDGARVLIMDDEPAVARILTRMVTRLGATVEVASDGAAALEAYRRARDAGEPFSLVVADLTVPGGMGGKEMAERMVEADPGAKIIVSSGYSNDPVMSDARRLFVGVLPKPYAIATVGEVLGRVLAM